MWWNAFCIVDDMLTCWRCIVSGECRRVMGPGCRVLLTPALCVPTAGGPGEGCGDEAIVRAMTDGGVIDREPYATGCFLTGRRIVSRSLGMAASAVGRWQAILGPDARAGGQMDEQAIRSGRLAAGPGEKQPSQLLSIWMRIHGSMDEWMDL